MQEVFLDAPRRDFSTPRHEAFELTADAQVHCIAARRTLKSRIKRRRAEVDMMIGLWKRCRGRKMPIRAVVEREQPEKSWKQSKRSWMFAARGDWQ